MTNAPRETELYRQLVASGVSEAQAINTVQAVAPDPANDPETEAWLADIRRKGLAGKHTIEMTPAEMKTLCNPDASKGGG